VGKYEFSGALRLPQLYNLTRLIIFFLYRQLPTAADKEAFDLVKGNAPNVETHPHTYAWFCLVSKFHDSVRTSWAAAAAPKGAKPAAAPKKEAEKPKVEAKPEATAAADDDELDLFGDGPSEVSFR
jgi:hypothetical protein